MSASRARSTPRVIVKTRDAGRRSVRAIPRTNPRRRRGALRLTPRRPRSTRRNQCQVEENTGEKHTLALALATVFLAGLVLPKRAFTRVERTARTALTGATTGVPTRVDMANIFVCYVCVCQNGKAGGDAIEGGFGFNPGSSSHTSHYVEISRDPIGREPGLSIGHSLHGELTQGNRPYTLVPKCPEFKVSNLIITRQQRRSQIVGRQNPSRIGRCRHSPRRRVT